MALSVYIRSRMQCQNLYLKYKQFHSKLVLTDGECVAMHQWAKLDTTLIESSKTTVQGSYIHKLTIYLTT